jgi:hypothetical protein
MMNMNEETRAEDIERNGFIRQTVVAIAANMAAATIHSGVQLDWKKIVPRSMEGAKELWEAIKQERAADE